MIEKEQNMEEKVTDLTGKDQEVSITAIDLQYIDNKIIKNNLEPMKKTETKHGVEKTTNNLFNREEGQEMSIPVQDDEINSKKER